MRSNHSFRPKLEGLEGRWVPATIRLTAGSLFVSNQVGALTVETTAVAGQLKITDNAKVVVVNGVGTLVSITGTNLANKITFTADLAGGNKQFPGNVLINSGNGADTVDLNGRVGGNATLLTGLGNDTVTSTVADVSIGGGLTFSDTAGLNTVALNGKNYTVGGNVSLYGVGVFDMGAGNTLKVGGAATLTSNQAAASTLSVLLGGDEVIVGKTLQITGGALNDVVSVTAKVSIGGSLTLNLRGGDNTFLLTPTAGGSGVNGSLFYSGEGGGDVAVFGADSSVSGNTTLNLGNGINTFVDDPLSLYSGDLTVNGDNDTNTVIVAGAVSGNFNNTLGNGDGNTTVFSGTVGGRFRYRLGSGTLGTLTLAPAVASTIDIDAIFGTGDSTFTLGPNVTLNGIVQGTGGAYTFNQGTAILAPTLIFLNYPA
jgi:hypothetical protein